MRPRLPPWLEGRIEGAVPIENGDWPVLEGTPAETVGPADPGGGTSVEELFAYYLPFHFYTTGWGTYIRAFGLDRLARILAAPGLMNGSSLLFCFRLLIEHERLHFLAELAASRLEVASGLPSYRSYFGDRNAATHEEALANAQAFTASKRGIPAPLAQVASSWMSNQGPGYRDFFRWLGYDLAAGKREAASFMVHPVRSPNSIPPTHYPPDWPGEFLFEERRKLHPPTYLVVDQSVPWLRIARPFPKLHGLQVHVHTNDHKPPHIHIQVLKQGRETRYEWPCLRPLRGDPPLSRADEKGLRAYVDAMRSQIDSKVRGVPWT